jgi:hypothetical protein
MPKYKHRLKVFVFDRFLCFGFEIVGKCRETQNQPNDVLPSHSFQRESDMISQTYLIFVCNTFSMMKYLSGKFPMEKRVRLGTIQIGRAELH